MLLQQQITNNQIVTKKTVQKNINHLAVQSIKSYEIATIDLISDAIKRGIIQPNPNFLSVRIKESHENK